MLRLLRLFSSAQAPRKEAMTMGKKNLNILILQLAQLLHYSHSFASLSFSLLSIVPFGIGATSFALMTTGSSLGVAVGAGVGVGTRVGVGVAVGVGVGVGVDGPGVGVAVATG